VAKESLERFRNALEEEGAIITSNMGQPVDTINYSIDEAAPEAAELSISQVKNELNLLGRGLPFQAIIVDDEQVESNMKYADEYSLEDIDVIKFSGEQAETFPLDDFVTLEEANEYQTITHNNGNRQVAMEEYNLEEDAVSDIVDGLSDE